MYRKENWYPQTPCWRDIKSCKSQGGNLLSLLPPFLLRDKMGKYFCHFSIFSSISVTEHWKKKKWGAEFHMKTKPSSLRQTSCGTSHATEFNIGRLQHRYVKQAGKKHSHPASFFSPLWAQRPPHWTLPRWFSFAIKCKLILHSECYHVPLWLSPLF